MKYLKQTVIAVLLFNTLILQAQQIAICDIGVDADNTLLNRVSGNSYALQSIIHHPYGGNDDDAGKVHVNIQLPVNAVYGSATYVRSSDATRGPSWIDVDIKGGGYATITFPNLKKNEFVEFKFNFEYEFNPSYSPKVMIEVWPERPIDGDLFNNFWKKDIPRDYSCLVLLNEDLRRWRYFIPDQDIRLIDICEFIDCDRDWAHELTPNWRVFIEKVQGVKGIAVYDGNKMIAKSQLSKSGDFYELRLPKDLSKKTLDKYAFRLL